MNTTKTLAGVSGLLMAVALSTTGCATKKYVRQQTSPIQQRVEEVDKKHAEALASLEAKEGKDVSRVEERAMGAENKANDASRAAQTAQSRADEAAQSARAANELGQQNQNRLGELSSAVQNIDNYKLVSSDDVLFGFNKAALTREGKAKLDQMLQQTNGMGRYVVEVEGFTDRSGPRDYNLALSRRRADAVVRYLVDRGVPLRRVHMIGLGFEQPQNQEMAATTTNTANQTASQQQAGSEQKLSRKQQRRVVVRIFAPETTLSAAANSSNAQTSGMNNSDNGQSGSYSQGQTTTGTGNSGSTQTQPQQQTPQQ